MSQSEIQMHLDCIYALVDLLSLLTELEEGSVKLSPHTIGAVAQMIKQNIIAIHEILDRS